MNMPQPPAAGELSPAAAAAQPAEPGEIGVDKNTTVVFPAPLMTTIAELGSFLTREKAAAGLPALAAEASPPLRAATANGAAATGAAEPS